MTMKNWQQNTTRIGIAIAVGSMLAFTTGCDEATDFLQSDAPPAEEVVGEFRGDLLLESESPVSGGTMSVTIEIAPPDDIQVAATSTGEHHVSKEDADIFFETQIRYTGALLGGHNAGDFVPYLDVSVELTNRDTGESMKSPLVPHVSIAEGYHYGMNLALVDTLGASEAGYDATVTVNPATVTSGIIKHSDISSQSDTSGTLLGNAPFVFETVGFGLGDFKNIVEIVVGGGDGEAAANTPNLSDEEEPAGSGYAY